MNDPRFPSIDRASLAYRNIIGQADLISGGDVVTGALGQVQLTLNSTNLQLAAYNGNQLTFADGTTATISSALTLAPTSLSASTLYYIYATYSDTDVDAIEASTTSYSTTSGIRHMTGNTAKALVGWARTNASTAWADDRKQRFVRSAFNEPSKHLQGERITSGIKAASGSFAETDAATGTERVEFIALANEVAHVCITGFHKNDTAGGTVESSIAIDGTTPPAPSGISYFVRDTSNAANDWHSFSVPHDITLAEGYHFAAGVIRGTGGSVQSQALITGHLHGAP